MARGRPKKMKLETEMIGAPITFSSTPFAASREVISPVSVDFSSEQLNNLAAKLNEVIEQVNRL